MSTLRVETYTGDGFVFMIVSDVASGTRARYTTHKISLWGLKATEVIGSELDLEDSREIVRKHSLNAYPIKSKHGRMPKRVKDRKASLRNPIERNQDLGMRW